MAGGTLSSGRRCHDGGGRNLSAIMVGGEIGNDDNVVGDPRSAVSESVDVSTGARITAPCSGSVGAREFCAASMVWKITRTSCLESLRSRRCVSVICITFHIDCVAKVLTIVNVFVLKDFAKMLAFLTARSSPFLLFRLDGRSSACPHGLTPIRFLGEISPICSLK